MRNENTAVSSRTILLISYHFHPSMEIGARRPTALAQFLVSKGVRVVVVSAFEGTEVEPGAEVLPGMTAVPVRPPQSTLIEALVYLKRRTARGTDRTATRGDSDGTTAGRLDRDLHHGAVIGSSGLSISWMNTRHGAGVPAKPRSVPAGNTRRDWYSHRRLRTACCSQAP